MVAMKALFCLALCALTAVSSLPTHEEVIQLLRPRSDEIRSWVLTRLIGTNQGIKKSNLLCSTCEIGMSLAYSFIEQGTYEEVEQGIINICVELDILSFDLCDGAMRGFFPHVYHILTERQLSVNDICGFLIQNEGCGPVNETLTDWEVFVDQNKPNPTSPPFLPDDIPTTKILHVTDIHADLDYAEGSLTECGKPMCCRKGEHWEEPWNSSVMAGAFGDYNCDIPVLGMQNAFADAANRHEDYKFVILGGDYVHHGLWFTTIESILEHFVVVADGMHSAFPDTPIYPVIGNHESHPSNVFPPRSIWEAYPEFNFSWIYNKLGDLFASHLTSEALATFKLAGYYTMVPEPGIRVITLNTNFCYTLNFWILFEPADPEGQLQWFSAQMHLAEQAGEKVFILGHIPPGADDCWSVWNNHFSAVVDRYQNIIVGQFYGHTHNDDFRIFFDGDTPSASAFDGIPTTKILHVTDIHADLDYVEGSLTECGKPMCCRKGEHWEEPWNSSVMAGPFGEYNCDIPVGAMQNAFVDAANRYDYKFVILGGDYVHHGLWFTTKESILDHYVAVADGMHSAFPHTPIYPVIGNHESHPSNVFPPRSIWEAYPAFDFSWIYHTLGDLFASQLTPEALETFRLAGYYTMVPEPGLRIITLNTNFCYTFNFWILYEPADPEGQLQWFSNQMHLAEKEGEKVFILGHHPPGNEDCWSVWNNHFSAVGERYQNIIVGQFYGHNHNDDFKIFFDGDTPSASAFISPSVTPWENVNSGYKVFHYDGARDDESTWEMVNYETFTYNLTEANANGEPNWYKLYSAKESYGLSSVRPAELYDFVLRMAEDDELFQLFYLNFNKNSDVAEPCVEPECVRDMLCSLLTSNHNDKTHCDVLDERISRR